MQEHFFQVISMDIFYSLWNIVWEIYYIFIVFCKQIHIFSPLYWNWMHLSMKKKFEDVPMWVMLMTWICSPTSIISCSNKERSMTSWKSMWPHSSLSHWTLSSLVLMSPCHFLWAKQSSIASSGGQVGVNKLSQREYVCSTCKSLKQKCRIVIQRRRRRKRRYL